MNDDDADTTPTNGIGPDAVGADSPHPLRARGSGPGTTLFGMRLPVAPTS